VQVLQAQDLPSLREQSLSRRLLVLESWSLISSWQFHCEYYQAPNFLNENSPHNPCNQRVGSCHFENQGQAVFFVMQPEAADIKGTAYHTISFGKGKSGFFKLDKSLWDLSLSPSVPCKTIRLQMRGRSPNFSDFHDGLGAIATLPSPLQLSTSNDRLDGLFSSLDFQLNCTTLRCYDYSLFSSTCSPSGLLCDFRLLEYPHSLDDRISSQQ
jgi:hypothetical protein